MEVARPWSTGASSGMLMTPQVPYLQEVQSKILSLPYENSRKRKSQMRVPLSLGRACLVHTRPSETHSDGT